MKKKSKTAVEVAETLTLTDKWKARLARMRLQHAEFCTKYDIGPAIFCRYLKGNRHPPAEVAARIESALLKEEEIFSRL